MLLVPPIDILMTLHFSKLNSCLANRLQLLRLKHPTSFGLCGLLAECNSRVSVRFSTNFTSIIAERIHVCCADQFERGTAFSLSVYPPLLQNIIGHLIPLIMLECITSCRVLKLSVWVGA